MKSDITSVPGWPWRAGGFLRSCSVSVYVRRSKTFNSLPVDDGFSGGAFSTMPAGTYGLAARCEDKQARGGRSSLSVSPLFGPLWEGAAPLHWDFHLPWFFCFLVPVLLPEKTLPCPFCYLWVIFRWLHEPVRKKNFKKCWWYLDWWLLTFRMCYCWNYSWKAVHLSLKLWFYVLLGGT